MACGKTIRMGIQLILHPFFVLHHPACGLPVHPKRLTNDVDYSMTISLLLTSFTSERIRIACASDMADQE
mgnify:CR=1 FL=1